MKPSYPSADNMRSGFGSAHEPWPHQLALDEIPAHWPVSHR